MKPYNRIIILVLDSVGCGVQEDYKKYQPRKSNTLQSIYENRKKFSLPNLEKLGLLSVLTANSGNDTGIYGKMREQSVGNDTFAGIWEVIGVPFSVRFRSKKTGFRKELIIKIENGMGTKVVGNEYISGCKALDKFYEKHKKEKSPILYLAEDGVVLLAGHEAILPARKLNSYGKKLAAILSDYKISRVITRPFVGVRGNFIRTKQRKDFITTGNLEKESILPLLQKGKIPLITTEHLFNILCQPQNVRFIRGNHKNKDLIALIANYLRRVRGESVMLFCLQDFDMYGHKKDVEGYAKSLIEFDSLLPNITESLKKDDLLFITADHGCDPTINLRGHTREYVPLLAYSPRLKHKSRQLGVRNSFADLGQTICYNFNLKSLKEGNIVYEVF